MIRSIAAPLVLFAALASFGCGGEPQPRVFDHNAVLLSTGATPFPDDARAWPRYHSTRFRLSVPLPDGKAWRIDDHTRPELVARHAESKSELVVASFAEPELMNRATCEEKAREKGLVPTAVLTTVEDGRTVGPEAYDTRLLVAIEPGNDASQKVTGHVLVFGAFIRQCLFVHFTSEVSSGKDEEVLSARLAMAKVRLVGGLTLDPPRTTGDAEVPREKERLK